MWRRVFWYIISDVLEEHVASIFIDGAMGADGIFLNRPDGFTRWTNIFFKKVC
jgi:hypothetical protein